MSRAQRIRDLEKRMARIARDLEILKTEPDEPGPERSVVFFEKTFTTSGVPYTYVALKAGGKWWLTGQTMRNFSWPELLDFIGTALPSLKIGPLPHTWERMEAES